MKGSKKKIYSFSGKAFKNFKASILGFLKKAINIFKTTYSKSIFFRRFFWFGIVFLGGLIFWQVFLFFTQTLPAPGGVYKEGVLGQPKFLNPIFAENPADFDISFLIFSSLFKEQNKEIVGDLAERWEVSSDFKVYKVILKDNAFWHDGQKVSVDDVIFTLDLINNPNYRGFLRGRLKRVEYKKIDDKTIQFILSEPSPSFLKNLTFGILPKHILSKMSFPQIVASSFNFNPVGSGPYKFVKSEISQLGFINSVTLEAHDQWHFPKPYIREIVFKFYPGIDELLEAYKKREVIAISEIPLNFYKQAKNLSGLNIYRFPSPRYIGIFFNLKKKTEPISSLEFRKALFYAIDRDKIIEELGLSLDIKENSYLFSAYLKDIKGLEYNYNPNKAKEILSNLGYKDNDGNGILEKDGRVLQMELISSEDPQVYFFAEKVVSMWKEIGVDAQVQILDNYRLSQVIKEGSYGALIQGVNLDWQFDPYYWWHSNQCGGNNFSCLKNENLDKLLLDSQKIQDPAKRLENYKKVFEILSQNLPAIPLVSVDLFYGVDKKVGGIEEKYISYPYQRFGGIEKWYINYIRVLKKFSLPGWRNW